MVGNRNEPRSKHESPGPGAYSQTFYEFGRSPKRNIILLSRPKEKPNKHQTPGPGAYNPESKSFVSSSKGIILLGRHKENLDKDSGPGPGTYDVRAKYFDDDIKKISFGHGNRFTYYVSPSKDKHTKNNFTGRVDTSLPGPGTYSIRDSPRGPKFSIGGVKDNKDLFKGRHQSPGPGSYSIKDELEFRLRGGRFSSSKRPELKVSLDPGPGHYDQDADILKNSPAYSLKGRFPEAKPDSSPGPGHYLPKLLQRRKRRLYLYRKKKTNSTIS